MSFNMDGESSSYKTAQRNFYNWTSKWFQSEEKEPILEPDVIEIVTLLQTLGFKISFFDFNNPNDVSLLQNGKRGLKVNITCGNSGLRCCLELGADCRCPKNTTDVIKWEVSGTEPNSRKNEIKEVGSNLLLPVAKGEKTIISEVLNHFLHIVNANTNDCNENEVKTPSRETQCITDAIAINVISPEPPMSPYRHRSIDSLAISDILTIPGKLESLPALTCSTPNLSGLSYPSSSPVVCSKLKQIQGLIKDVLNLVDTDQVPSPMLGISKIKYGSTESLPAKGMTKTLTVPLKRQSSRGGSTPNLPMVSKIKPSKPMCNKYSHVKSTIPKASAKK